MAEYDPEQAFIRSMQDEDDSGTSASENLQQNETAQQPRTLGGFIMDDDEDEEESPISMPQVAGSNGLLDVDRGTSNTPQRPLAMTPDNAVAVHDVSSQPTAQDPNHQGASVANGDTNGVPNLVAVPNAGAASEDSDTAQPAPTLPEPLRTTSVSADVTSLSLPKARLPHDRVGILEDRIREDPRGDIDAWLSLISEHKKRNKLEDARNTYEKFFKVFPSAVGFCASLVICRS